LTDARTTVTDLSSLLAGGWTYSAVRAQLQARRWQRLGRAIVLHNGRATHPELCRVALVNCGARAVLTAFTSLAELGLRSWEREQLHVLVPGGTHVPRMAEFPLRLHYAASWNPAEHFIDRRLHRAGPSLALAAGTFRSPRPACGLLAAGVQQRLVAVPQLRDAVDRRPRLRHRAALLLALDDIAGGAQALSEIDFARLCRRYGLPEPARQAIRAEPSGKRRYLDAQWITRSGRRLAVEVDGALHLVPRRWWDDQLRQNELVLAGDLVLRFPTVVVRHEPLVVVGQLARGLLL
jgi:hypothetical protein